MANLTGLSPLIQNNHDCMLKTFTRLLLWNVLTALYILCAFTATAQTPAVPGAEGAGMYTTGGRGTSSTATTVFEVTNLNDDGLPGSFRYALTASAAYRTVVFRVSGTIHLSARLTIPANTTIAGQTAPGDGICVADHPVYITGNNVIVRYMRFRLGDRYQNKGKVDGSGSDDAFGGAAVNNIIIDHVTASWSTDEALTIYRGDNLTIQWCMMSEPLNYSYHFETGDTDFERHGFGGIWGAKRGSMHHNLFAHCNNRTPRFAGVSTYTPAVQGAEMADFRNNVIYNWGINTIYGGEGGYYNVVNNYLKPGPSTTSRKTQIVAVDSGSGFPYAKYYLAGNYNTTSTANSNNNWSGATMRSGKLSDTVYSKVTTPFDFGFPVTTQSAADAYDAVLNYAGCSLPNRDTLDQRIVNDVRNGTGSIIDVQGGYPHGTPYEQTVNAWPALNSTPAPADTDHDGMPDSWESSHGLDPTNASDRNGAAANGYTNLENYLNSLTNAAANTNATIYANHAFTPFAQTIGSPSAVQTFQLSGSNLSGNITVTAPANYELSLNGTTWSSNLILTTNAGAVPTTTISVRLNAPANGAYSGIITASSTGATTINMPVSGTTANQPPPKQKQIIGVYPVMEGGFENQPAGAVSTAVPTGAANPSPTEWTTSGSANIVSDGSARTGSNYFTYTSTSLSTKNNFSPAVSNPLFTNGAKYIVQYYYRAPAPAAGNQMGGLIAVTDNSGTANFTTNYTYQTPVNTNGGWLKFTGIQSVNPAYTPTTSFGGFRFNGGGSAAIAKPFDIDDFVVYAADNQAAPAPDATAPDAATGPAASGNASSIDISWTAPATGVDGGGYIVVRSSNATPPVLNANGIYAIGNNIGSGNVIVFIGANTGFTDDGTIAPITAGVTYYYHIFTADKAFNYSTAVTVSGSTAATGPVVAVSGTLHSFSQTVGTPAASQSFTVHGNNLTGNVQVAGPAGFELSADNNTWTSSLNIQRENNTVLTTAFIRLNAANAGSYSGNITVSSPGATDATMAVSGTATNPVPAGYDVVVAQDGSGNYTSLQAAINAAPSNRTTPYRILVRKGKYIEKVTIPASKPFLYVIGEGINEVVFSWDDYAGKPGVTEIATITINSNDCLFMNLTVENSWGRKNDGPQALAVKATGDRIIFKNCKMVSGQDTVMAHGNGKRQYFRNCYIDGNTDYIYGSAIAVFDSCVLFNRDRVDGSTSSVFTAASTPAGQTYGYVFRDCLLPNNNGQTAYTLGRPWGNSEPPHTSETKVVFLNCRMGTTVKPERWQVWSSGTNTSLVTYAEYKTRYFNGGLVDLSKRLSWTKEFSDAEAAPYYVNSNLFGSWDPCAMLAEVCAPFEAPISLSNFRVNRSSSQSTILFNICWPINGVTYELHRSTDSINFSAVNAFTSTTDTMAAFKFVDAVPAKGVSYFYKIVAKKSGYAACITDTIIKVNKSVPLTNDFRSVNSGPVNNSVTTTVTLTAGTVSAVTVTGSVEGLTGTPTCTFSAAPSGGITATGTPVVSNGKVTGVTITNPGAGYTSAPSITWNFTGAGGNTVWQKYSGTAWVNQPLGTAPSNTNVTVSAGTIVTLTALSANNNLTIESGGVLQGNGTNQLFRLKGDLENDGVLGGDANAGRLSLQLDDHTAFNNTCNIRGGGTYKFTNLTCMEQVKTCAINIAADLNLAGALQGWYNNSAATLNNDDSITVNILPGVTVTAASLHASTTSMNYKSAGIYTYNIDGTLDLSNSTTLSSIIPQDTIAGNKVLLNVNGVLKTGTQFRAVSATAGAVGKVALTIGSNGVVDASKITTATNFTVWPNFFIVSPGGRIVRTTGSTDVVFPLGTAAGNPNRVTLKNSGTTDKFSVAVKNSLDHAVIDPTRIVNKQWDITEDVTGGSNATVSLTWTTGDHAAAFDPTEPVFVLRYNGTDWEQYAATITGTGTATNPYAATASGITGFSSFAVANYMDTTAPVITSCPAIPVQCYADSGKYIIPLLQATDNAGSVIISYAISGATGRTGQGADASGSFNEGVSTINWTVTDERGNKARCQTTVTVNPRISVTIPDVYAMNAAVDEKNTIYLGYGPTSLTVSAMPAGGSAPYTYQWSNGQTTKSVSVAAAGAYTVVVNDVNNCSAQAGIVIKVTDVRCGKDSSKVMVCHNGNVICVEQASVQDHLNHGDRLNSCDSGARTGDTTLTGSRAQSYVAVYPNPAVDILKIQVGSLEPGATVQLYNQAGVLVRSVRLVNTIQPVSVKGLMNGIYLVMVRNGGLVTTVKVLVQ
jgi:pectin methylesterase-like acyl-CoA thioesterase